MLAFVTNFIADCKAGFAAFSDDVKDCCQG